VEEEKEEEEWEKDEEEKEWEVLCCFSSRSLSLLLALSRKAK